MKTLFIIPLVLMSLVPFPSWGSTMDDLVERDDLYYKKFTDVPFTGEIYEGLVRGNFKNGRKEGPWIGYHENGQLRYKGEFKNGEREGPWIGYLKNGQLSYKGVFKNDEPAGPWIGYLKNGQLSYKGVFKNGEREGTWVGYYGNGQLQYKGEYKNGFREGTWVFFNKDGTKRMSEYKVGEIIFDEGSGVYRNGEKVSD